MFDSVLLRIRSLRTFEIERVHLHADHQYSIKINIRIRRQVPFRTSVNFAIRRVRDQKCVTCSLINNTPTSSKEQICLNKYCSSDFLRL